MDDDLYGLYDYPADFISPASFQPCPPQSPYSDRIPIFGSDPLLSGSSSSPLSDTPSDHQASRSIRAKIASHPLYPTLLQSYIDCQKVGAPPDIACSLDEIRRESEVSTETNGVLSTCFGADPELDDFMETYCDILMKFKSDLARPFDEATTFLKKIELQLNNLCNGVSRSCISDEVGGSSEEDMSVGEIEVQEFSSTNEARELKDKLLRKYSGYISTLKQEFSKTKKKGKLPREAKQILMDWWNIHCSWPYPTEADKIGLAERTGLDQKQINNWFINQRKRHWKPSDNIQFALMQNLYDPIFHQ